MTGALEERYDFADALAVGTYLNVFVRNCDRVAMANLAQMVNAIAPVVTSPQAAVAQPIYYPVLLHARAALDAAVDVHVTGPVVDGPADEPRGRWPHRIADLGPFTLVDAAATASRRPGQAGPHAGEPEPGARARRHRAPRHVLRRAADITTVTAETSKAARALPDVAGAPWSEGSEKPGRPLSLTLPPQSFTLIEVATTS